ncbi:hypothetical protein [Pseudoduganella sp. RAF53_2]|jgi:hypothetical protein|uniref:hypothetical protein n=1 Tax=unclassified Pseudoduganella TaxID=2637179 RepID=UPI003F990F6E
MHDLHDNSGAAMTDPATGSDGHDNLLQYDPNRLLDFLIEHMKLKNDAALARALAIMPPMISKVRSRRAAISPALLVVMHEASGVTIEKLREEMGDRRLAFTPIPDSLLLR